MPALISLVSVNTSSLLTILEKEFPLSFLSRSGYLGLLPISRIFSGSPVGRSIPSDQWAGFIGNKARRMGGGVFRYSLSTLSFCPFDLSLGIYFLRPKKKYWNKKIWCALCGISACVYSRHYITHILKPSFASYFI